MTSMKQVRFGLKLAMKKTRKREFLETQITLPVE